MVEFREYTALVVDDLTDTRDLFRQALEMADFIVSEASNGETALDLLKQQVFDLLILDLHIPRIDGVAVLKALRHDARFEAMRIIVATGNPHMVTQEIQDLIDYVQVKPFDFMAFVRLAERMRY